MSTNTKKQSGTTKPPVVREYDIGNTKYIVTATVRDGANQDAAAIVRRLIRNDTNLIPVQNNG